MLADYLRLGVCLYENIVLSYTTSTDCFLISNGCFYYLFLTSMDDLINVLLLFLFLTFLLF